MGKEWNTDKQRWEVDGEPISYRVTWDDANGESQEREFRDIDQGFDFYQSKKKQTSSASWEHLDGME